MKRKTKRIFSLLLALAVMATMMAALPLTASAEIELSWQKNSKTTDDYTITTDENGVTTFDVAAEKSVDGAGWYVDLSSELDGLNYAELTTLKFSYDFMIEKAYGDGSADDVTDKTTYMPSSDGYIDLATSNTYTYGADAGRLARYNIQQNWNQFNYYGATTDRTNGGLKFGEHEGEWYTLVTTIDFEAQTVSTTTTVGGSSATYNVAAANFATSLTDGNLYLSVMPTRTSSQENEVKFSVKDIAVSYTKKQEVGGIAWIPNSKVTNDYTVTVDENGITTFDVKEGKSVNGAGWYANLSSKLDGLKYTDLSKLIFSYDFMIEKASGETTYMPSSDGYIDLSTLNTYNYGADTSRLARYNLYNNWNQFNYYGATADRTNGGLKFGEHEGEWYTLVTTIDFETKTVSTTTTVGSLSEKYDIAAAYFATSLADGKLYLNITPTRTDAQTNEVKFSLRNIDVSYETINPGFGEGDMDSGYYTDAASNTLGVIRFLQAYSGDTPDSYGFYFVNSEGTIILENGTASKIENSEDEIANGGFYGDLTDIPENDKNTYYAKPFVKIGGTMLYGDAIDGTVDWEKEVNYPETAAE